MNVPFFNYPRLIELHKEQYQRAFEDVTSRGAYILQKDLKAFEENIQKFLGVKHVIGVADGTNALLLGLMALGLKEGDEVIVPSHTFIASPASIALRGATPVLADMADDGMLCPEDVKRKITSKTKAIMPVQVNGRCCDMDSIMSIAKERGLMVVEDAAQALGAKYKDTPAGTFGAFGTFSLYPAKNLGCFGDGGLLVTNDDDLAKKVLMLRDHGRSPETGEIEIWGTNSRLDNLQASFLNVRLQGYEEEINRRREIASRYNEAFKTLDDLILPPAPEADVHFDIYQNYELQSYSRDTLTTHLKEKGVGTLIQWSGKAIHQHKALGFDADYPKTNAFFEKCFMIPMSTLLTDDDVNHVIDSIKSFYN